LFVACGGYLFVILVLTGKPVFLPMIGLVVAYLVMGKAGKQGPGTRRVFGRRRN
jgi:hypothetical protein